MTILGKLRGDLADLKKPSVLQKLNRSLGTIALNLVQGGFDRRTDPYGVPWKPTRQRNPILERSGTLRKGIRMTAADGRVTVRTTGKGSKYAPYHQSGTRPSTRRVSERGRFTKKGGVGTRGIPGLPARKFMPDQGTLPAAYDRAFQNEATRFLTERFNRRR